MDFDELEQAIQNEDLYVDNPQFHALAFTYVSHRRKKELVESQDLINRALYEEYDAISRRLDKTKFQEGCAVRNVLRTRRLATLLIDDKGDFNLKALPNCIESLKKCLYSLGPDRQYDSKRMEHVLNVVKLLKDRPDIVRLVKSIDKPTSHKYADQIIRDTLSLPSHTPITDAHTRRAVLAALMCSLRQSVGSCFATAPAIMIQEEMPALFLKDVRDLLNTGRLKRTFGGVEYAVPLSTTWGAGDLKKPFKIPTGEDFQDSFLWLSPGLGAAFESAGLLDSQELTLTKTSKIKLILEELFSFSRKGESYVVMTAEEIIKQLLMKKLNITLKDLEDYENRSIGMIHGGMFFQPSIKGLSNMDDEGKGKQRVRSKRELCALFYEQVNEAGNALKELSDNALLKAWEFSIASFAETKAQFTRWNLYSSLGLGVHETGGIGSVIYEIVKRKVEETNQRVREFQNEYEMAYSQLKMMESRVRSVSNERDAKWLQAEYQSKRNEFYTLEEIRDKINRKGHVLANLYELLIDKYDALFPKYFQEVYDADMQDIDMGQYDDSPAGFRLIYKYGRVNTSQWTYIKTPQEFTEALVSFFTATEVEISSENDFKGLQQELSEIVTQIVTLVRTKEFLESAFYRMAASHHTKIIQDPLEHLDKIDKKPWAYTSGGTMDNLVSCYFSQDKKPTEIARWVENPMELLIFLTDTLKHISPSIMQGYIENPDKSMLMHSPTHAFLLKPGKLPFSQAWQNESLTYIWTRDHFLDSQVKFLDSLWMDQEELQYLIQKLSEMMPREFRYYFIKAFANLNKSMRPKEFKEYIVDEMDRERGLRLLSKSISTDAIDAMLYSLLPLFPKEKLRDRVEALFLAMPSIDQELRSLLMKIFDMTSRSKDVHKIFDAESLQSICKGLLCLALDNTSSKIDYHVAISCAAETLKYSLPKPIIFADTNWVKDEFGFVVNPGTSKFELWRVDSIGRSGSPMSSWENWLNGSRRDRTWGVYVAPNEYTG